MRASSWWVLVAIGTISCGGREIGDLSLPDAPDDASTDAIVIVDGGDDVTFIDGGTDSTIDFDTSLDDSGIFVDAIPDDIAPPPFDTGIGFDTAPPPFDTGIGFDTTPPPFDTGIGFDTTPDGIVIDAPVDAITFDAPSDAPIEAGVHCGPTATCDGATQDCCAGAGGSFSCVSKGTCGGIPISCSSAAACPTGESCCFTRPGGGGTAGAACAASCSGADAQLCATNAECPTGQRCRRIFGGYRICR